MYEVYQGDSKTLYFGFITSEGAPMNVSGYSGIFTAKWNYATSLADAIINSPISILGNGATGLATYTITTGQSSNCPMDYVQAVTLFGPSGDVSTHFNSGLRIIATPYSS